MQLLKLTGFQRFRNRKCQCIVVGDKMKPNGTVGTEMHLLLLQLQRSMKEVD